MNKKKWYQTNIGIVFVILLFFPIGFYLMWKYGTWKTSTFLKIVGVFFLLGFLYSLAYNLGPAGKRNRAEIERIKASQEAANRNPKPTFTPYPTSIYTYEIVEKKENSTVDNYMVLIKPGDDGENIAMDVKKTCSKPCNIDIYDDRQALDLQKQYDEMMSTLETNPSDLQNWKKQNYVYVADHLVGYVSFELESYQEYPYKDWYYKELKGK